MKRKLVFIFSLMLALGLVYFNTSKKVHVAEFYPVNYTVEEATKIADTVVIGTIKKVGEPTWNSPNGKKPSKDSPNMKLIFKPTIVEVSEYLKNPQKKKNITIINPGGTVGRDTMILKGVPTFEEGQKVVLFLLDNIDPGDGVKKSDVVWCFRIDENGKAINLRKNEQMLLSELKEKVNNSLN